MGNQRLLHVLLLPWLCRTLLLGAWPTSNTHTHLKLPPWPSSNTHTHLKPPPWSSSNTHTHFRHPHLTQQTRLHNQPGTIWDSHVVPTVLDIQPVQPKEIKALIQQLNATQASFLASVSKRNKYVHDGSPVKINNDPLWDVVLFEAAIWAKNDPQAAPMLTSAILSHESFVDALACLLGNKLASPFLQATQLRDIFRDVVEQDTSLPSMFALDVLATGVRDLALPNVLCALLFHKGFHALSTYRMSHVLWTSGRTELALYMQSLNSAIFSCDIHPAAQIGKSCYVASGAGIVIGETCVVGDDVSFSHGVTLGGTGKESGDRHPKVERGVFFADRAYVLGNIRVGEGAIVMPHSVVLKPVPPYTRVTGVPAKVVSYLACSVDSEGAPAAPDSHLYVDFFACGVGT